MSNPKWTTKNGRTSQRGLFVSGIWHCDCDTRLPAEKFQVKNGGKNHGRWFYTCQKPQQKRCSFFLWSDDAKIREEAAVLNNTRTEPGRSQDTKVAEGGRLRSELKTPKTPKRQTKITEPITPMSRPRTATKSAQRTRQERSPTVESDERDESFEWSSSADDDLAEFAESLEAGAMTQDDEESPRKIAKTSPYASPSKRSHGEMLAQADPPASDIISNGTWRLDEDVFRTPSTSTKSGATGLLSPGLTPARVRRQLFPPPDGSKHLPDQQIAEQTEDSSALTLEVLSILSPVRSSMSPSIEKSLVTLLNKHELRTHGIEKGRDIARTAVQAKEKNITELQQRIAALEAEKETSRMVIQHLKADIATSPKKPRRPRVGSTRRSEV